MIFSIITVCKNTERTIEKTIQSVLSQTESSYEYIIIDGASSDQTLEIISNYRSKINKIVSEQDGGIYQAMNKGLRLAQGEWVYFLNSGDQFFNQETLKKAASAIKNNPEFNLLRGKVLFINPKTQFNKLYQNKHPWTSWSLFSSGVFHPGAFCHRSLFFGESKILFDESYKIAADYDWILKLFFDDRLKVLITDIPISQFSLEGISSNKIFLSLQRKERWRAKKNNFPPALFYVYAALWPFKWFLLKIFK